MALARWRRRSAVPLAVAGVGLAGMSLQFALLFAFQALHGYVYAEVSLLVTAFMAGLALGGEGGLRILASATTHFTPAPGRTDRRQQNHSCDHYEIQSGRWQECWRSWPSTAACFRSSSRCPSRGRR